jgi:hypothetical protein
VRAFALIRQTAVPSLSKLGTQVPERRDALLDAAVVAAEDIDRIKAEGKSVFLTLCH